MISMTTRFVCVSLSTMAATALVAFANPAAIVATAQAAPHAAVVVATQPAIAHRG